MHLCKIARNFLAPRALQCYCYKNKSGALGKTRRKPEILPKSRNLKIWPDCPAHIHLVNEETVDVLVKAISEDLRHEKAIIFEASPGAGHVTKALLEKGASRVRVFVADDEDCKKYLPNLKELEAKYPQNMEICFSDLLSIHRLVSVDMKTASFGQFNLFADEVHAWSESPPIKLIAPLAPAYEHKFLRPLFKQLASMTGIFTCGRTELFTFVSDYEYYYIGATSEAKNFSRYTYISVLYNSLFNVEHIKEVPYNHFSPDITTENQISLVKNRNMCHLIKLSPRVELMEKISPSLLSQYVFFTRQAMTTRKANVIAYFEKWIPGCGPKLIKFGIPLLTRFGDLNPHQFFDLFCEFSTWEEFEDLNMKTIVQDYEETVEN